MMWAGLAILISYMTGGGDDTRAFLALQEAMTTMVVEVVEDEARQQQALGKLRLLKVHFRSHRDRLKLVGDCIEKADRSYTATRADYLACRSTRDRRNRALKKYYVDFKVGFRASFTDEEWKRLGFELRLRGLRQ